MAVKIYSDVTKRFYDDEAAALKAEKDVEERQSEAAKERKRMAQDVDEKRAALREARKTYDEARKEYDNALRKFCEKFGTYHMTLGNKDLLDTVDALWDFWNW